MSVEIGIIVRDNDKQIEDVFFRWVVKQWNMCLNMDAIIEVSRDPIGAMQKHYAS
jgi:hypothetical protein